MRIDSFTKTMHGQIFDAHLILDDELDSEGCMTVKVYGYNSMAEIKLEYDQMVALRDAMNRQLAEIDSQFND